MRVQIKTWEQMLKEFGINEDCNDIDTFICFTEEMEDLLPDDRIIEIFLDEEYTKDFDKNVYIWDKNDYFCDFYIVDEMIEKIIEK